MWTRKMWAWAVALVVVPVCWVITRITGEGILGHLQPLMDRLGKEMYEERE